MEKMEIGSVPAHEDCQQVGSDNYDGERARLECRTFIEQLRRQFGREPEGASLTVTSNSHDFGVYLEVACRYDDKIEAACAYAFKCEGEAWPDWDAEARKTLGLNARHDLGDNWSVEITERGALMFQGMSDAMTLPPEAAEKLRLALTQSA